MFLWRSKLFGLRRSCSKATFRNASKWLMPQKNHRVRSLPGWIHFYRKTGKYTTWHFRDHPLTIAFWVYINLRYWTPSRENIWFQQNGKNRKQRILGIHWYRVQKMFKPTDDLFLLQQHEEIYCRRFPLTCPNSCGKKEIPREEVSTLDKTEDLHKKVQSVRCI